MFKSKKMILIIVLVALVGVGGAGMLVVKPRLAGGKKEAKAEPKEPPHNLALEEFTVNLADIQQPRYLKTTLAVAFESEAEIEEAKRVEPQIRDAVIMILTRQYFNSLLTWQGKRRLRVQLREAVNHALEPMGMQAKEVVFTAFVME
jgi:flagellar FliL protein